MEKQALETQKYASKKLMGHCRKPEEIIKYLETNEKKKKKPQISKIYIGCSKRRSKRKVYSDTGLPQETRKTQKNNPISHPQELEKEEETRPKEIIKIREEINKIATKKKERKKTSMNLRAVVWKDKTDKPVARFTKRKERGFK